jgi:hypothetical protein
MKSKEAIEGPDGVRVSPLVQEECRNRYGSVVGLEDGELADPWELERCIRQEEWGPVLALPERTQARSIRPAIDEDGGLDWGAFGTVDFDRHRPKPDRTQYKVNMLREERANCLIRLSVVAQRVPGDAKWLILRHVHQGILSLDDIVDEDVRIMAGLYRRAERLRKEIAELEEKRRKAEVQRAVRMFGRW